jgi:hypothetical protein
LKCMMHVVLTRACSAEHWHITRELQVLVLAVDASLRTASVLLTHTCTLATVCQWTLWCKESLIGLICLQLATSEVALSLRVVFRRCVRRPWIAATGWARRGQ